MFFISDEVKFYMHQNGVNTIRDLKECIAIQRYEKKEHFCIARKIPRISPHRRNRILMAAECRRLERGLLKVLRYAQENHIFMIEELIYRKYK